MSYDICFFRELPPIQGDNEENRRPLKDSPALQERLLEQFQSPQTIEQSADGWKILDEDTAVGATYGADGVALAASADADSEDLHAKRVEQLRKLAEIIEGETGLQAYDPQLDASVADTSAADALIGYNQFAKRSDAASRVDGAAADSTGDEKATDSDADEKAGLAREVGVLLLVALVLYCLMQNFIARPYLIPSESMEPTLHGCAGCVGDRIMVDKMVFRFTDPRPGDVIVFKGPPAWDGNYRSIRSSDTAIRYVQNALSFIGIVPPDENDLVKRVIATGGQTVECRRDTGLTVNGKKLNEPYLDPATIGPTDACWGIEFGPVKVPEGKLWMMGDNRTHSGDSRAHCQSTVADANRGILCTGDPNVGTVPVPNVIGLARFIAWPPSRWGLISSFNPQS